METTAQHKDDGKEICPSKAVPCGTLTATDTSPEVTAENVESIMADAGCKPADFPDVRGKPESTSELKDYGPEAAMDFPFETLFRRMDGDTDVIPDSSAMSAADVITRFLSFMVTVGRHDARMIQLIATRAIAAAWVIRPDWFNGRPAHEVATAFKIPHTKFSEQAAAFSRQFYFRNQYQRHSHHNLPMERKSIEEAAKN